MTTTLALRLPSPVTDLQGYLQAVHSYPLLSAEEEHALALRYSEHDDLNAAWRLVTSHLRYVAKIARGYRGYGLPQEDLIQEGNIGLMKAVKRFDPAVGVRLASFAIHWIRAEIHEFVLRNWRIVKVATTKAQRKLFFNLRSAKQHSGCLSTNEVDDLAEELGVRTSDVVEMDKRLQAHDAAFDGAAGGHDATQTAPAALFADRRFDPGESVAAAEWSGHVKGCISRALETLDDRSRDIVTRRWLQEPKVKLHELAYDHGISAERVRQIETAAFAALRKALEGSAEPVAHQD